MTAYEQRSYPGAATDTVLTADLALGGTAFSVTTGTGTGYPDGTGGPFFVIIDYDNSKAEKIRCSGRVNDTFTVAGTGGGRGQDGTTAVAHPAPAKVRAVWTATDAQETNRAAVQTIGKVTSKGDLLAGTGANALTRVAAGADATLLQTDSTQAAGVKWSNTGVALDATSSVGGVTGTALAATRIAWTAYTPGLFNITQGNGTLIGRYLQIGKTIHFKAQLVFGSTTSIAVGAAIIGLPVAVVASNGDYPVSGSAFRNSASSYWQIGGTCGAASTNCTLTTGSGQVSATVPFAFTTGDAITVAGTYESA